jgi:hypothetical protein
MAFFLPELWLSASQEGLHSMGLVMTENYRWKNMDNGSMYLRRIKPHFSAAVLRFQIKG